MDVKINLRIITKNHAVDSKIGTPLKIDFRADRTHEPNPTAWDLKDFPVLENFNRVSKIFFTKEVIRVFSIC